MSLLRRLACVFLVVTAVGLAAEPVRVILVFDASGSMEGRVAGGRKIEVAKRAVAELVGSLDPAVELGLMAYGHRKRGACDDIELLVPPAAGSGPAILRAVAGLEARGKTPLTEAVVQAARHLRHTERRASVVLISDGVETCDRDPCSSAEELERTGVDFTCHVIGFDLRPDDASSLACLAHRTGGIYFPAADATGLKDALGRALRQTVAPATTLIVEPRASSGGPLIDGVTFELVRPAAPTKVVASGAGGRWTADLPEAGDYLLRARRGPQALEQRFPVKLGESVTREFVFSASGLRPVAFDKAGGSAYEQGVRWEVFGPPDAAGRRPRVAFSHGSRPTLQVPAGEYLLEARRGEASARQSVTVPASGILDVSVVLGSGTLKLAARAAEGQPPLASGVTWRVFGSPDAEGTRKSVATSHNAQPTLTLPSGSFEVRVEHGSARGRIDVELPAGEVLERTVVLGSGRLRLAATLAAGMPKLDGGVSWKVFEHSGGEERGPHLLTNHGAQPTVTVPAGAYLIEATWGHAQTITTATATVSAGGLAETVIVLDGGQLDVSAVMSEGAEAVTEGNAWRVYRVSDFDGRRAQVANSYNAAPAFRLPAGRYLVEVQRGVAWAEAEAEVGAGRNTPVRLNLNAGTLLMTTTDRGKWEVFSERNSEGTRKRLFDSSAGEARVFLPVGRYLLTRTEGQRRAERTVEIRAATLTEVDLALLAAPAP